MTDLVLASGSRVRATLMENAGLSFTIDPAKVDERAVEEPLLAQNVEPQEIARVLAQAKAIETSTRNPGKMVVGADQILAFEGTRLTKPENMAAARAQLESFSGKAHALHAGVCVAFDGRVLWETVSTANLHVRTLSPEFLDWYMETAGTDILSSVGAYQLESVGIQLFQRIEGDYFTILGLPMLPLLDFLRKSGTLIK